MSATVTVTTDPVQITQDLIRVASITPIDAGAQDVVIDYLAPMGFTHYDVTRGGENDPAAKNVPAPRNAEVRNSFFRLDFPNDHGSHAPFNAKPSEDNNAQDIGKTSPHLCFAGHTDVVPPGDEAKWTHPPFSATIDDGKLYGRGTADMKGNIACFIAALGRALQKHQAGTITLKGSISLLITGDEEGFSLFGTKPVLQWMDQNGHRPDYCLVGEPSNPSQIGDSIKIGRRGSLNGYLTINGKQGHVAYPDKADNPIPRMAKIINALCDQPLDDGSDHFPASSLQISTIDVGNPADNVIPASVKAHFNIRYNDQWNEKTLQAHLEQRMAPFFRPGQDDIDWYHSADSFITHPGYLSDCVAGAVEKITGRRPALKTDGGTSDARFIYKYCPVVECGLVNKTIHQIDEHTSLDDLETLTQIYEDIIITIL